MKIVCRLRLTAVLPVLLIAVLLLLQSPLFGQSTGSVVGIVADSTGAVIPNAVVILTNELNGTTRKSVSNGAGYFVFASVFSSTKCHLKVTADNFKSWQSQPFALRPGDQVNFADIKLEIGTATTEVTVEATNQSVKTLDNGERSDVINSKEMKTLAVVGRDATELVRMLPGFAMDTGDQGVNNKAGYNSAVVGFSGPTGSFSANGTGTDGVSVVSDGASLTDIGSNQGSVQSVNIDMVEEIKVSTSSYGADNAKGPTVVNAIGKSGSSAFHGSAYFHARDTTLNANDWYDKYQGLPRQDGRYLYPGATLGGPVIIPHTNFNKNRDKMFFFAGAEYYHQRYESGTLGSWVPTMSERRGDFSKSSMDAELCGARPDGQVNQNAIQLMCTTQNYYKDGTPILNGNVTSYANKGGVSMINWLPLPNADPFTNSSGYNYVQQVVQNQNGSLIHGRIDYNFNDNNKLFASYGRQSQITEDPVNWGGWIPTAAMAYPGGVTSGDVSNTFSVNYTRVINPRLTNELTAASAYVVQPGNMGDSAQVSRFHANDYNCVDPAARKKGTCGSSGNGNYNYLGQFKNAGDYSMPALSDYGEFGYPQMLMPGGFYSSHVRMKKLVPNVSDTVSWVKRTHLIKAGIYVEKGILNGLADTSAYPQGEMDFSPYHYMYNKSVNTAANFVGCYNPDSAGTARTSGAAYIGNCMNPVALMYMGLPDDYTQSNFSPIVNMQYTTFSIFANDSWKVHHNVTLTLGARFEHLGPWLDRHDNGLATFSPTLYKEQCDAATGRSCTSDMPGMIWHGQKGESAVANSVSKPSTMFVSPRVGLAWDVFGKGKTVLRGGWGAYRSEEAFNPYALAAATGQGYKNSHLTNQLSLDSIDSQTGSGVADFNTNAIDASDTKRPIHYEYNFTISQNLPWKSMMEVAYVGSDNENLSSGATSNSDINVLPFGSLFSVNLNNIPSNAGSAATDLGNMTTSQFDSFRKYPYYQHMYVINHNFYSSYNSLQASWNRNVGAIQFGVNYTFSKNLSVAQSYTSELADPVNLRNDYNPAPYDRTHVFNGHYLIDLGSHYHGGSNLLADAINGWQISGISTLQSGPPLASIEGGNFNFYGGQIEATEVPHVNQVSSTARTNCQSLGISSGQCVTYFNNSVWLGTPDVLLMPTVVCNPTSHLSKNQYLNPTCFGLPNVVQNGAYRLPYIHGPAYLNHDLTLLKNFKAGEKKNVQFRLAAFNFLNHPLTSFNKNDTSNLNLSIQNAVPGQAISQAYLQHQNFGIANVKYGARLVELSVRYEF